MFRLSTKGRYGVRAMFDLALHYDEGLVSLKSIAERQEISEHYLEQLIAALKKAGLVKSIRGAQGGYMLSREPSKITIGEILRALEGSLSPSECIDDIEKVDCPRAEFCVTRKVWEKVKEAIENVVDSVTLQNLVDDYKKMTADESYMFYI
ncbi:transcriptional regulator, BadM/Rrf2 family [Caldicellulosiruptor obsidiansis OB47]|uniref:Transcriptional regulator, BadM/Rrf2 family n=1 Tax=Caldicellulosiruptor obsidiansis (strain ATCC BAA-2073 / JCM 16842 / OB47) TaxID=608506 RepID=D9TJJ6_CALOO|nr:Rrf2 family transcriptional regulator [Caldicellulosiruptor obsidiansis]ADL42178.1 transcriptional regulator, BadM/Rrf2 family [Caldicellulosiruptor obsidiansis OB47]